MLVRHHFIMLEVVRKIYKQAGVPESVLFSKMKKPEATASGFLLAPPVGLEPTTLRLTAACSTD